MIYKKINPKENVFNHIELSKTTYALFDSEFDQPIMYGSRNRVELAIKNLSEKIRINYYKVEDEILVLKNVYDKRKAR